MANTTNNVNTQAQNPMKVITGPDTRWSYANVWEAKSINGGTPKFSVSLIIPKSDTKTITKIKAAIEAAYREGEAKLKGNGKTVPPLAALKTPLRDGDTERPDDPAYNNAYFINSNSERYLYREPLVKPTKTRIDAFSHTTTGGEVGGWSPLAHPGRELRQGGILTGADGVEEKRGNAYLDKWPSG